MFNAVKATRRRRGPTRWIPAMVAVLFAAACGEDGPTGPGGGGTPADVESFRAGLPTWNTFSPPVDESLNSEIGDPVGATEMVEASDPLYDPDYVCTKTPYSLATNPTEVITMSGALGLLVPGKLLQGAPHRDGELRTLPIAERAPVRLTISLNNVEGDAFRLVDYPSEGTLKTAVNELIQAAETSTFEAGTSVSFQKATSYSFDQAALGMGLSVRYMGSSVEGSLQSKTSAEKLTITASFVQNAFTIGVDTPPSMAGWFSDELTDDRLATYTSGASPAMGPDNLPIYVSDVTYGRIIMVTITSTGSESDIKASLDATYNGGFWGGELSLTAERKSILKESEISIQQLGGPTEGAFKLANVLLQDSGEAGPGDFGLAEFFAEDVSLTTYVPISYTLRNLSDNSIAGVGETSNYTLTECEPITQTILSDFEADKDGWTTVNGRAGDPIQANNPAVARVGTGYLYVGAAADGKVTYFIAPPKFLGDKSDYVGGTLSFWQEWEASDNGTAGTGLADVLIYGVGTPKVLAFDSGIDDWPEDEWLLRTMVLEESPQLLVYDDGSPGGFAGAVPATTADIEEVLANVAGLRIRGEYRSNSGYDFTRMDHVVLEPAP